MITILSMLVVILAFFVGTITGQKLNRNEKIEIPKIKKEDIPLTKEHKEAKAMKQLEEEKLQKMSVVWDNVNNYNGTSDGQRSVD